MKTYKNLLATLLISSGFATFSFAEAAKEESLIKKIELETWIEAIKAHEHDIVFHAYILDVTLQNNFGLIYSSGQGTANQKHAVKDIAILPTYTYEIEDSDIFSEVKFISGVALPTGKGVISTRNDNTSFIAMLRTPMRFNDGRFNIEAEAGYKKIFVNGGTDIDRPHLGLTFDTALFDDDFRFRYMIYTGPFFEVDVPSLTNEVGVSYVHDETVTYDLLVGTQPELERNVEDSEHDEYWVYAGVRLAFESFE